MVCYQFFVTEKQNLLYVFMSKMNLNIKTRILVTFYKKIQKLGGNDC